jgi:glycosyl transferase family 87
VNIHLAGALLFGVVFGVGQAAGLVSHPIDADIYWRASLDNLYGAGWGGYLYPPPMAQILAPLHLLPYGLVIVAWTTLLFGCLWYCARWATLPLIGLGFLDLAGLPNAGSVVLGSVLLGNVTLLMAAAVVAGIRHPAAWPIAVLTKQGPAVGLLWHVLRRDWPTVGRAVGLTIGIVAVSFALDPSLWTAYVGSMLALSGIPSPVPVVEVPWAIRLVAAVAIVAAARERTWLIPIAAGLAVPALYGWESLLPVAVGAIALGRPVLGPIPWPAGLHPRKRLLEA